jgi:transposase
MGVNEHLPDARLTFDKFHVVAHASKALDTVRRQHRVSTDFKAELSDSKYADG